MNYRGTYQVIVVGGGPAGIAAACSAAREGVKTLLVEKYGFLGGMWTTAHVSPFMTTHFKDQQVNAGLLNELIQDLKNKDGVIGPLKCPYEDPSSTYGTGGHITIFDGEKMRTTLFDFLEKYNVEILLHSFFTDVVISDSSVKGIKVLNKSGEEIILSDIIIDATGDADVSYRANVKCTKGDTAGRMQPMSLMYYVGGVDIKKLQQHVLSHKEDFAWYTIPDIDQSIPAHLQQNHIACSGFYSLVEKGKKNGDLHTGRNRLTIFSSIMPGVVTMNATRVINLDGTNVDHLTLAEIDSRRQAVSITNYMRRYAPGFENSFIVSTPAQIGIRETRQIVGDYIIKKEDIMNGKEFPDTIAKGAFPVDIHQPDGSGNVWEEVKKPYSIPYRSLVPSKVDNLLVAGRCISATHEAMAGLRVTPVCFSMGEAAGTASSMASIKNLSPRKIDIDNLRKKLKEYGAII